MPPLGSGTPAAVRFWRFIERGSADECWEWRGALVSGYGKLAGDERLSSGRARMVGAHRLSWEIHNGPIPDGLWVLHRCDNPPCVNPHHLFLGTHTENMRDRKAKGRAPDLRGARHGLAKLSDADVTKIRNSHLSQAALASDFGVSRRLIRMVLTNERWKHVTPA